MELGGLLLPFAGDEVAWREVVENRGVKEVPEEKDRREFGPRHRTLRHRTDGAKGTFEPGCLLRPSSNSPPWARALGRFQPVRFGTLADPLEAVLNLEVAVAQMRTGVNLDKNAVGAEVLDSTGPLTQRKSGNFVRQKEKGLVPFC